MYSSTHQRKGLLENIDLLPKAHVDRLRDAHLCERRLQLVLAEVLGQLGQEVNAHVRYNVLSALASRRCSTLWLSFEDRVEYLRGFRV